MDVKTNKLSDIRPLISILVPIYNVEKYLKRCIDSVLSQNFQDYELILVDDGSPDGCSQICDEYAKKDCRIKVIHKQNGGANSARFVGYKRAQGKYLVFMDADDWLLKGSLDHLRTAIESDGGFDVVKSLVERVSDNNEKWIEHYSLENGILEGEGKFFHAISSDNVSPYLHSGIYRKDLFSDESFVNLEKYKISVGDDWINNYFIAPKVRRVKFISTPTYAYFLNTESMMGGSIYGWEYYAKIEKCMAEINKTLDIKKPKSEMLSSALHKLRFFFIPEVPFNKEQFKRIQPIIVDGLRNKEIKKSDANPYYLRFIGIGWLYQAYTIVFRFAFLLIRLKGKKRKLLK